MPFLDQLCLTLPPPPEVSVLLPLQYQGLGRSRRYKGAALRLTSLRCVVYLMSIHLRHHSILRQVTHEMDASCNVQYVVTKKTKGSVRSMDSLKSDQLGCNSEMLCALSKSKGQLFFACLQGQLST